MSKPSIIGAAILGLAGLVSGANSALAAKPEDVQVAAAVVKIKGHYDAKEKCHVYDAGDGLTVKFYPDYNALKVIEAETTQRTVPTTSTRSVLKPGWRHDVTGNNVDANGVAAGGGECYDYITVRGETTVNVVVERIATDHGLKGTADVVSGVVQVKGQRIYDGAVSQLAAQKESVNHSIGPFTK